MSSILTDLIRTDGEYRQLLKAAESQKSAAKQQPICVTGLCDGAADAAYVSLLEDLKTKDARAALLICPEEKECVRLKNLLCRYGVRTAFYMGRDLTFYNITASHEYEHERLRVLSALLEGELDAVVTTPDGETVLSLNRPGTYAFAGKDGLTVQLAVEEGRIRFLSSGCPDKVCVRSGWLSRTGQTAACLPAGVVVRVQAADDAGSAVDMVAG